MCKKYPLEQWQKKSNFTEVLSKMAEQDFNLQIKDGRIIGDDFSYGLGNFNKAFSNIPNEIFDNLPQYQ